MATNQLDKALLNINKAIEISPLSPNHHFTKGNVYFLKKEYTKALIYLDECLKIDPNFTLAIETKLACFILLNDTSKFRNYIATMPQLISPKVCEILFSLFNDEQQIVDIDTNVFKINERFKNVYPWQFYLLVYSGKIEKALHVFENKIKLKIGQLVNFQLDPFLEPLRQHPQFQIIKNEVISSGYEPNKKELSIKVQKENSKPLNATEISKYKIALIDFIKNTKPYLNPNLSLRDLGNSIALHPNKLSWLLNAEFNKNFNDYINQFRLLHFKTIALNPRFKHITLLGLAYDSGFNSKSVFNTYFKKAEGITPSQWVKSHSN